MSCFRKTFFIVKHTLIGFRNFGTLLMGHPLGTFISTQLCSLTILFSFLFVLYDLALDFCI